MENNEIFGTFNGKDFISHDGKRYFVPPNYASKSKILEGDEMVLRISPDGIFTYKQIHNQPFHLVVGRIYKNGRKFVVKVNNKFYNILDSSANYYKLKENDEVTVRIPWEHENTTWVAIESPVDGYVIRINKEDEDE